MMTPRTRSITTAGLLAGVLVLSACGTTSATSTTPASPSGSATIPQPSGAARTSGAPSGSAALSSTEQAVAPETNPAGDISDTQAFVPYHSAQGSYTFDTPEGWARTENGSNVAFTNKFNGVKVDVAPAAVAPSAASARTNEAAAIQKNGRAVQITKVEEVTLPGSKAVRIAYTANSDPDPVTNKQVRLENVSYVFFKDGKEVTFTLYAPLGADNVDQWQRMAQSFKWG